MKISVTADSTCDLSPELLSEYGITLMPLTIVKDGVAYLDTVNITASDIFSHVDAGGDLCSTTAANIGEYADFFAQQLTQCDAVIHISLGSGFSSCYQNAALAAQEFDTVRVIDSRNLSTGHGLVVLKAAQLVKDGGDPDEIKKQLDDFTPRVESSFLLDQLKYMVKGGRCSSVAALGANLLNLKPCIEVRDGKMSVVKKYRGSYAKCLSAYVKDRLADRDDIDRDILFVTNTPVTDECYSSVMDAVEACGNFRVTYKTVAGCTVSCHCGPGTLGVLFVRNK